MKKGLLDTYQTLLNTFGKQKWWPTQSEDVEKRRLEICIGAILTQNTAWKNVEKALKNLIELDLIDNRKIMQVNEKQLALLIKPAGYYNQKARKLKAFASFLEKNSFEKLERMEMGELRNLLLTVHGVGKETADSIILYALNKPVFVIDAYTKRVFSRLVGLKIDKYDKWQELFHSNLEMDAKLFNEYHALIVELGKNYCKNHPLCEKCPISNCSYKAR